jgi:pimeloyl-ACP methyl ester carboxylesterase
MILIPGYSCSGEVWNETVTHLKDRYECHVLTLPGYAGIQPIAQPILQTVRDQIIRYMREKHLDRPILMGHSLGAFMSLWVASQVPDQVGKLICVDGVPFISALMNPAANADSLRKNPQFNPETVATAYVNMPTEGYEARMTTAMLGQVRDTTHARQIAHWSALSDRKTLGYTYVEMCTTDLRDAIAHIESPTLVLGSLYYNNPDLSRQALTSQYAKLLNKTIAVANMKHFIMYDDPTWLYGQIDSFLQHP